jgi:hypothetical protein
MISGVRGSIGFQTVCAALRSAGIPARLDAQDQVEFWDGMASAPKPPARDFWFHSLDVKKIKKVLHSVFTLIAYALLVVRKAERTACLQTDN